MKILFIVPYVPSQIYVRPYNLIKHLATRGHHITVLTVSFGEEDKKAAKYLRQYCHQVVDFAQPAWRSYANCMIALPSANPLQSVYCWQPDLIRHALALINKRDIDVIHIEHLRGARYGLALKKQMKETHSGSNSIPIIWDSVDCITHLFRQSSKHGSSRISRLITQFEKGRTAKYEAKLIKLFDHVLITSQIDKDALLSLTNSTENLPDITVLRNGVDLSYFSSNGSITRETDTLVISGKMSYHANVEMVMFLVNDIMPIVWTHRPNVHVWIVGKNPPQSIVSLGKNPNITVTGAVDEIRPYLQRATLAVAPLRYGAGIQNKVLEAMACTTPVVTTPQGINALNIKIGEDIIVEDDPTSFARAILYLLDNPHVRDRIGKSGRKYVEKNHNWSDIVTRLEDIYLIETNNKQFRSL